jgi:hypothetical protein
MEVRTVHLNLKQLRLNDSLQDSDGIKVEKVKKKADDKAIYTDNFLNAKLRLNQYPESLVNVAYKEVSLKFLTIKRGITSKKS